MYSFYFLILHYTALLLLCQPPSIGWRLTYCFTDVRVSVGVHVTPITKGNSAQIVLGGMFFLFPRALAFVFCYDLDLCSQGQDVRVLFLLESFFPQFCQKYMGDLDQTSQKTLKTGGTRAYYCRPSVDLLLHILLSAETSYYVN